MADSEWESDGICTPPQIIFADDVCDEAIDDETELDGSIPSHQITEIVQENTSAPNSLQTTQRAVAALLLQNISLSKRQAFLINQLEAKKRLNAEKKKKLQKLREMNTNQHVLANVFEFENRIRKPTISTIRARSLALTPII